ncbi:MAG TPA: hypothetical protein VFK19_10480 [Sphingomicrobium sp.]|nr:hypothetical protein [Sphingomicrobium sp.]
MVKVRVNWGATDGQTPVTLFQVWNTRSKDLLVLAPDKDAAMKIAYTANHLHWMSPRKDTSYPHANEVRPPFYGDLVGYEEAIERAIAQRVQGTVHLEDGGISVRDEFFSK